MHAASADADDRAEEIFMQRLVRLEQSCKDLPKFLRIRVSKWVEVLSRPMSNLAYKRNRNSCARLLLSQVESATFSEPFDKVPPHGPLGMLPAHLATPRKRSVPTLPAKTPSPKVQHMQEYASASRTRSRLLSPSPGSLRRSPAASEYPSPRSLQASHFAHTASILETPASRIQMEDRGATLQSVDALHDQIDEELAERLKIVHGRLEKTSETLQQMGTELEKERSERVRLEVELGEARVLIKGQAQRIDQLETEMSTLKALSKREKARLQALHKIEIGQLKKMKDQEIDILLSKSTPARFPRLGDFDMTDPSRSNEAFLAYLDEFGKKGQQLVAGILGGRENSSAKGD